MSKMSNIRTIRVLVKNAQAMTTVLHAAGYEASWTPGASTHWDNGCCNPACCPQHPDATITYCDDTIGFVEMDNTVWATITTNRNSPVQFVENIIRNVHYIFHYLMILDFCIRILFMDLTNLSIIIDTH